MWRTTEAGTFHQADVIQGHSTEAVIQIGSKDDLKDRLGADDDLTFDPAATGSPDAAPFGARVGLLSGYVHVQLNISWGTVHVVPEGQTVLPVRGQGQLRAQEVGMAFVDVWVDVVTSWNKEGLLTIKDEKFIQISKSNGFCWSRT